MKILMFWWFRVHKFCFTNSDIFDILKVQFTHIFFINSEAFDVLMIPPTQILNHEELHLWYSDGSVYTHFIREQWHLWYSDGSEYAHLASRVVEPLIIWWFGVNKFCFTKSNTFYVLIIQLTQCYLYEQWQLWCSDGSTYTILTSWTMTPLIFWWFDVYNFSFTNSDTFVILMVQRTQI